MDYSAELAAAHHAPAAPYFRERVARVLHWLLWIATFGLVPAPRRGASASRADRSAQRRSVESAEAVPVQSPMATRDLTAETADRPTLGLAAARFGAGAAAGRASARLRRGEEPVAHPATDDEAHSGWWDRPGRDRRAVVPGGSMARWERAFDSRAAFGGVAL